AARVLPPQIAARKKTMYRANMGQAFVRRGRPRWVEQLLSPESLRATGCFDPAAVALAQDALRSRRRGSLYRFSFDMGLIGVTGVQLWHHLFCGGVLDVPASSTPRHQGISYLPAA